MEALNYFLGAEDRVVEPSKFGEARYIACPLGYPVLVGALVRTYFEKVAGRRPTRRSGTTEGFHKDYVEELARQHQWQPKSGGVVRGMKLTDGTDPKRAKITSTATTAAKAATDKSRRAMRRRMSARCLAWSWRRRWRHRRRGAAVASVAAT